MVYLQMLFLPLNIPKGIAMIDIHKLNAFVAVVEENNISRAAQRLHMQQPLLHD